MNAFRIKFAQEIDQWLHFNTSFEMLTVMSWHVPETFRKRF